MSIGEFTTRWSASGGSEMSNFLSFAGELCDVLGTERPKPAQSDGQTNDYRFERAPTETHPGARRRRRIDLYRRGCFVMEAKQGAGPKAEAEQLSLLSPEDAPHTQLGHGRRGSRAFENDILMNLVALNHARAEEEARGHVRWLRPDHQDPDGRAAEARTDKLEFAAADKAPLAEFAARADRRRPRRAGGPR